MLRRAVAAGYHRGDRANTGHYSQDSVKKWAGEGWEREASAPLLGRLGLPKRHAGEGMPGVLRSAPAAAIARPAEEGMWPSAIQPGPNPGAQMSAGAP